MSAPSDDEDVVVENSALYHHLKNVGFKEFEVLSKCSFKDRRCDGEEKGGYKPMGSYLKDKIKVLANSFNEMLIVGLANAFKTVSFANEESLKLIMEKVYNSKILLDEDVAFLQNFTNDSFSLSHNVPASNHHSVLTSAACLSAYGVGKTLLPPWCLKSSFTEVTEVSFLGITGGILAYSSMQWLFGSIYNGLVLRGLSSLSEMLEVLKDETLLIKKCLTIIQEAELVARGFMLPSARVPTCRLEISKILPIQSPERQCPELRESLFFWTREAFVRHKEATLCLLEIFPLQQELDAPSIYLACSDMSEFGRLVELDPEVEEDRKALLDESEHFSLSSLKAVFQLMTLQRSEFLRRFTLCFLPESSPSANSPFSVLNTLRRINSVIQDVTNGSLYTLEKLKRIHNYYKSMWTPRPSSEKRFDENERKLPPYLSNLQHSVHSTALHLQAAIMRVNEIEDQIDYLNDDEDKNDGTLEAQWNTELFTKFQEIRSELEASKSCLDDGEMVFNSACRGRMPGLKLDLPLKIEIKPQDVTSEIPVISLEDPAIEDQVFEAYVPGEQQGQDQWADSHDDFAATIEKEKQKMDIESSARLFKELKSVLVAKAEEHRKREEKALEVTQKDPKESTQPHRTVSPSSEGIHLDLEDSCLKKSDPMNHNKPLTSILDEEEYTLIQDCVFDPANDNLNRQKEEMCENQKINVEGQVLNNRVLDICGNYEQSGETSLSYSDSGYSLSASSFPTEKMKADVTNNSAENSENIACECNENDDEVDSMESGSPNEYSVYEGVDEVVEYSDDDFYLEDTEALDKRLENLFSRSQKLFASSIAKMATEKLKEMRSQSCDATEETYGESNCELLNE